MTLWGISFLKTKPLFPWFLIVPLHHSHFHNSFESVCVIQVCACCEGASEAAAAAAVVEVAEDQPDLDIADTDTEEVGCQQRPGEEPTNTVVISCHSPSLGTTSETINC